MVDTQTVSRPSRSTSFLMAVQARMERDKAVGAALKRSLSGTDEHRRDLYPYLLPLLEGIPVAAQPAFFLVAALYATYPQPLQREHAMSFGRSCALLDAKTSSSGPERRLKSLLDTEANDLAVPISALIRLLKSHQVSVDYPTLLSHLRQWDHPDQWVQDRWARDFWAPKASAPVSDDLIDR